MLKIQKVNEIDGHSYPMMLTLCFGAIFLALKIRSLSFVSQSALHPLYVALGSNDVERQMAYRALFKAHIDPETLTAIRETMNKGQALGGLRFKQEIEAHLGRRVEPLPRDGDRRSTRFQERRRKGQS